MIEKWTAEVNYQTRKILFEGKTKEELKKEVIKCIEKLTKLKEAIENTPIE